MIRVFAGTGIRTRQLLAMPALLAALAAPPASAELGARAVPGDNCTPYNGFAVGFPLSQSAQSRIADQSVALADGWKPFGWIIITRGREHWFVPYPPFFTGKSDAGTVPGLVLLKSPDVRSIRFALKGLAREPWWGGLAPSMPKKVLLARCYSAPDNSSS